MRTEEMSVVDAAIALYRAEQTKSTIRIAMAENDLRQATQKLIFSCPQCNTERHVCPGCGTDVGHFEFACPQCEDDSTSTVARGTVEPAEKVEHRIVNTIQRLRELSVIRAARDYVHDNRPGLAEVFSDPANDLRVAMEELALWHGSDAHLLADLDQERDEISGMDQEMIDQEEALNPDHPERVINASTYPCWECTDPDEDPRSWCDCGGRTEVYAPCAPPCCSRAHIPGDCPNHPDRIETPEESAAMVDVNLRAAGGAGLVEPTEPAPEWTPAEWQHVLAGDRVRLGAQEADVTRSSVGTWHADNSDRYRPRPWEHTEVSISLAHLDQPLIMAPGGPVEILADRERAAVLVLQKAFPTVG